MDVGCIDETSYTNTLNIIKQMYKVDDALLIHPTLVHHSFFTARIISIKISILTLCGSKVMSGVLSFMANLFFT